MRRPSLRRAAATLMLLAPLAACSLARAEDTCLKCHGELSGVMAEPVVLAKQDIHSRRGFSCADCHGGDAAAATEEAAHALAAGFVGRPQGLAVLDLCGRCHSDPVIMKRFDPAARVDQVELYRESHHGKKLLEGDAKAATCTSCHGSHGILPTADPKSPVFASNVPATCGKCHGDPEYMKGRTISTDVVEEYRESVHGEALLVLGDLGAPACNSCHGNHGATPPEVSSVANVCGTCHVQQATRFRESSKKEIFDMNELPECVFCHSSHAIKHPTDAMLDVTQESSVCFECHEEEDDAGHVDTLRMAAALTKLADGIAEASELLGRAERAGMEVSGPQFDLSSATDNLTQARVLVHGFDVKAILSKLEEGDAIAAEAHRAGEEALVEFDYRRRGLYVTLVAIGLLALGLWLKIQEVDQRFPPLEVGQGSAGDA